jgi:hypothetical protein
MAMERNMQRSSCVVLTMCMVLGCSPQASEKTAEVIGKCPNAAKLQVKTALENKAYAVSMRANDAVIFINNKTASAIGMSGMQLLALNLDCATTNDTSVLDRVAVHSTDINRDLVSFDAVELKALRQKYKETGLP